MQKFKKILSAVLASILALFPLGSVSALGPFHSNEFTALSIPQQFDAIYFYTNFLKLAHHWDYETPHITLSRNVGITVENLLQWKVALLEYIRDLDASTKLNFFYCIYKMLSPNSTIYARMPVSNVRSFRMELIKDAIDSYGSPGVLRVSISTPITRETIII